MSFYNLWHCNSKWVKERSANGSTCIAFISSSAASNSQRLKRVGNCEMFHMKLDMSQWPDEWTLAVILEICLTFHFSYTDSRKMELSPIPTFHMHLIVGLYFLNYKF